MWCCWCTPAPAPPLSPLRARTTTTAAPGGVATPMRQHAAPARCSMVAEASVAVSQHTHTNPLHVWLGCEQR
eukprot:m.32904 g.32904  ORF g.32904 m.32904 type:complete len:72 (+) comp12483_c0_seq1:863-1078(+)